MRLNASTDYAIRLILYLAKESKIVSSSKLSSSIGFLHDICCRLALNCAKQGLLMQFMEQREAINSSCPPATLPYMILLP